MAESAGVTVAKGPSTPCINIENRQASSRLCQYLQYHLSDRRNGDSNGVLGACDTTLELIPKIFLRVFRDLETRLAPRRALLMMICLRFSAVLIQQFWEPGNNQHRENYQGGRGPVGCQGRGDVRPIVCDQIVLTVRQNSNAYRKMDKNTKLLRQDMALDIITAKWKENRYV